ncbi:hypothetical protein [Cellulomonas sp. ICMP 17802]|uniref:hypothetical protein n=1 Tax=Cellulomonas sp. ICMP 17802 TaxID=3239199 RepID=UPI00351B3592
MERLGARAIGLAAAALVLVGCTQSPAGPDPARSATTSPSTTASATTDRGTTPTAPAPTPSTSPVPGEPCDPADGSPDCTDATGADDGTFRYIEGYADCVADLGAAEAHGLCTDLDGDGRAGYPDSG